MKKIYIATMVFSLVLLGAACTETNSNNQDETGTTTETSSNQTTGTPTNTQTSTALKPGVDQLTSNLISNTGINFSGKNQQQMRWNTVQEKYLNGQVFTAQNISYEDMTKIEEYLRSQGFEPDTVNTSLDGRTVTIGYNKDEIVCKVQGQILGDVQTSDPNALKNARFNIRAGCGGL